MSHFSTCGSRYERGHAGVAEKIEHPGSGPCSQLICKPIPMGRLLRKNTDMFGHIGQTRQRTNRPILHGPRPRELSAV